MPFVKGGKKPPGSGRRRGTQEPGIRQCELFFKSVLESRTWDDKWRRYFFETPIQKIEPKLIALAYAYAYGRPREQLMVTGPQQGPVEFTLNLGTPRVINGNGGTESSD